jgi:large subunit ribosomal protein L24
MTRGGEVGGVIEKEGPIHISNVMLVDPKSGGPTRVRVNRDGGKRARVAAKSGESID